MSSFEIKTYIVQRADGEVLGVKLTFAAAQALAKKRAPARVLFALADKSQEENVSAHEMDRNNCRQLHKAS